MSLVNSTAARSIRKRKHRGCTIAFRFAIAICLLCRLASASATTVWIDTDPSIGIPFREVDDAFAILLAFRSPEIKIAGISTTYGNASLQQTTRIARDLVRRFGGNEKEVFPGASSPEKLGQETAATKALAVAVKRERLTYIALGPLTNLASFVRLHPNLVQRIDRIVLVGGQTTGQRLRLGRGGWLRLHDANVFKDPAAVAEILRTNCPITLAPIETSSHLLMTEDDLQKMRSNSGGEFLYRRARVWSWFWRRVVGLKGGPLFDNLAILEVAQPAAVRSEKRYAHMNENGELIAETSPGVGKRAVRYDSGITSAADSIRERLGE